MRGGRGRPGRSAAAVPPPPSTAGAAALRRRLLAWYDRDRRDLPWRRRCTLYGTWIAEAMLQQTTVVVAAPYWERFLTRFPDVESLARADEDQVLAAWSGLGYYRRARDLHAAARMIVARDGGRLPASRDGWLALPGVGRYTAGAVASIALGERVPAVDANARRVLARLLCATPAEATALTGRLLEEVAGALVDPRRPGDWNQALMDLAATVCRPAAPDCTACPIERLCRARRAGAERLIPPPAPARAATAAMLSLLVLRRGPDLLLTSPGAPPLVAVPAADSALRDDFSGLYRGLLGLPSTPWYTAPASDRDLDSGFTAAAAAAWMVGIARWTRSRPAVRTVGVFPHAITMYRLRVSVVAADLVDASASGAWPPGAGWRDPTTAAAPLSALATKALRLAGARLAA